MAYGERAFNALCAALVRERYKRSLDSGFAFYKTTLAHKVSDSHDRRRTCRLSRPPGAWLALALGDGPLSLLTF